jgi:hypothetical protein
VSGGARPSTSPAVVVPAAVLAGGTTTWFVGRAAAAVAGDRTAPWIVGRAGGVTAYLLLLAVVTSGLVLAHPWRTRIRRPSQPGRIRVHAALTTFALVFTVLHVVVLATDTYAGVGWRGALLPMGAQYRPVSVTLGLVGAWSGLLSGLTAATAGRRSARVWWPVHHWALLAFALVWAHGVLAGSDSRVLFAGYVVTGTAVLLLAVSRYVATTPAERVSAP